MKEAMVGGSSRVDEFNRAIAKLESSLSKGVADYRAWDEVKDLFRLRTSLVESERKREIDLKLYMNADQAYRYMRDLAMAVSKNVRDPKILAAIQGDFVEATTRGGGAPAEVLVLEGAA
jgi:hypothetical protein